MDDSKADAVIVDVMLVPAKPRTGTPELAEGSYMLSPRRSKAVGLLKLARESCATGRLTPEAQPGVARIGRLAVRRVLRGSALGRRVLQALIDAARARGERELVLHAQRSAIAFYECLGWQRRGPVFVEAGIEHQEMFLAL